MQIQQLLRGAFFVAVLNSFVTSLVVAQNAAITVTASVQPSTLTVVKVRDLVGGIVLPGETKTIDPTSSNAAQFKLTAAPNARVYVTLSPPLFLIGNDQMLLLQTWKARYAHSASPETGTEFDIEEVVIPLVLNAQGIGHLYVGMTIVASELQEPGTYTGTFTVTIVNY